METYEQAETEDLHRLNRLEDATSKHLSGRAARTAKELIVAMAESLADGCLLPLLCSFTYSRHLRRKEVRLVKKAIRASPRHEVGFFTLVLRKWVIQTDELDRFSFSKYLERFRYHLRQCGADDASGWLLARVHGEYEPREGVFWIHLHGVATGEMLKVVRSLKRYYRKHDVIGGPKRAVMVKPANNLPEQASYIFQSFWPCRYRGPSANDPSKMIRQRQKQRMPEPAHTQWMLKMAQTRPDELMLVVGNAGLSYALRKMYRESYSKAYVESSRIPPSFSND